MRGELDRLLADARARGVPESEVDSVYLRGEEAIAEHERRNGYDKSWGPNGVAATMRDDAVGHVPAAARHILV